MIKVLFVFRRKRTERLELLRQDLGPDEMLYGLPHLDPQQFLVDYMEDEVGNDYWWKKPIKFFEQRIVEKVGMGFTLDFALENLKRLRKSDVIITTADSCGLPVTFLKKIGLVKVPLIYISQGLSDYLEEMPRASFWRQFFIRFYSSLLRNVESILVLGKGAAEHLSQVTGIALAQIQVVHFGIDHLFWHPAPFPVDGSFVLSVGSDPARDYQTLIRAIGDRPLKIVTRLPVDKENLPANIEVSFDYSDVELRSLYQQARYVVIPLHDVSQPSGQSVALQAMACGKAVILTRTRGLWEPEYLRHLKNIFLVEPGDVHSLGAALSYCDEHSDGLKQMGKNARELVESRYTSGDFAFTLQQITQKLSNRLGL